MIDLLLRGGRVVDPSQGLEADVDVAVAEGKVVEVAPGLNAGGAGRVIDVKGCVVAPGLIDAHVHLSGIGGDTHAFGHRMAAATGVTTVLDMGTSMDTFIEGLEEYGAGLNVAALLATSSAFPPSVTDPSEAEIQAAIELDLDKGALGLKILGGHFPLMPEATARCIEVANRLRVHIGYHLGTTESSSNMTGFRELPGLLGESGRVHLAHVAAYCRGMADTPAREVAEAIDILGGLRPRVASESYLSTRIGTGNATWGICDGDEVVDKITHNALTLGGFEVSRVGMRAALADGHAGVFLEQGGVIGTVRGAEAVSAWEAAETAVGVTFPVTPPESAVALSVARFADGEFAVDALATDGGGIPRNYQVDRGLALVQLGALTMTDFVHKASCAPAQLMGLESRGTLAPGSEADITVLDADARRATMSFVAGQPIMVDGVAVGSGGTLLGTEAGAGHAKELGLRYEVVDPGRGLIYSRT